jgi:hypothetical protein
VLFVALEAGVGRHRLRLGVAERGISEEVEDNDARKVRYLRSAENDEAVGRQMHVSYSTARIDRTWLGKATQEQDTHT